MRLKFLRLLITRPLFNANNTGLVALSCSSYCLIHPDSKQQDNLGQYVCASCCTPVLGSDSRSLYPGHNPVSGCMLQHSAVG